MVDLALGVLGGVLAFSSIACWRYGLRLLRPRKPVSLLSFTTGPNTTFDHDHDWHIGGKDEGVVRYECACGEVKHGG